MSDLLGTRMRSFVCLILIILLTYFFSTKRRDVSWRLVIMGVLLQFGLGAIALSKSGERFFERFNHLAVKLLAYSGAGSSFVFGELAKHNTLPVGSSVLGPKVTNDLLPRAQMAPTIFHAEGVERFVSIGAYVAFGVLPTIIFFSSLMAILYHLGLMQKVVKLFSHLMQRTMGTTGPETLSAAGNIFLGQTEAPLLIRPFLIKMSESEIMAVMTGGFATVAGGVMLAYVGMLQNIFPDIAGHLLCASIMSAPASLVIAKVLNPVPRLEQPSKDHAPHFELKSTDSNLVDAAARGASEGLMLALNVAAMLIAFLSVVALLNGGFALLGRWVGFEQLTLEGLMGSMFKPIAYMMGVSWKDSEIVGSILGVKMVLNEFVGYMELAKVGSVLEERSMVLTTYALCGFANLSSIGIQIGGLSALVPEKRKEFAKLAFRAMLAGTLACFMTACVVGILT